MWKGMQARVTIQSHITHPSLNIPRTIYLGRPEVYCSTLMLFRLRNKGFKDFMYKHSLKHQPFDTPTYSEKLLFNIIIMTHASL